MYKHGSYYYLFFSCGNLLLYGKSYKIKVCQSSHDVTLMVS
jgi:hypothetical protein